MGIALMLIGLFLLVGFLVGFVLFGVINLRNRIGYVPVPRSLVPQIVAALDLKPHDTLHDLGCGDGRVLQAAVRSEPSIVARGVENNPVVYLAARLKSPRPTRIRWGDLFGANLADASVIFVYLHPDLNRRLAAKLSSELKPGARVVSLQFPIADWVAAQEIELSDAPDYAARLYLYQR